MNNQNKDSSSKTPLKTGNIMYGVFSSFVRLLALGYAALAVFSFFEVRSLLRESKDEHSFDIDDGTLLVPLILCFPSNLDVDGVAMFDSTTNNTSQTSADEVQCRKLDYLISACGSSLLFGAAACVLFVFCDFLARFRCCPFDLTSSFGMAIFLCFILVETGISVGALAEQTHFWVDHFKDIVDDRDLDLEVKSYANSIFLVGASLSSFGIAVLVIIDGICTQCCLRHAAKRRAGKEEETANDNKGTKGRLGWLERSQPPPKPANEVQAQNQDSFIEHDRVEDGTSTISGSSGRVKNVLPPWSYI